MPDSSQLTFLASIETTQRVTETIKQILKEHRQPSPRELVAELDEKIGIVARWDLETVLKALLDDRDLTTPQKDYLKSILDGDDLTTALRGEAAPDQFALSSIDTLLQASRRYRYSSSFQEMVDFMGRFRDYAPYNNMLVRIQDPSCAFYATERDWKSRFERRLKDDARPMIILAPMHPVLLVYDLDQTEGREVPEELLRFSQFSGAWKPEWLDRLLENAARHRLRVDFKPLSTAHSGFASSRTRGAQEKMRIAIHSDLSPQSKLGVLCHELAHVLLGHLGTDEDHWWPSRSHMGRSAIEIEAEAVAYIVTRRLGIEGSSDAYISRYLGELDEVPKAVSYDMIAKVSGRIEAMISRLEAAPLTQEERLRRRRGTR